MIGASLLFLAWLTWLSADGENAMLEKAGGSNLALGKLNLIHQCVYFVNLCENFSIIEQLRYCTRSNQKPRRKERACFFV